MPWIALAVVAVVAVATVMLAPRFVTGESTTAAQLDFAAFRARISANGIASVELHQSSGEIEGTLTDGREFTTQGPPGGLAEADLALLDRHGVERNYASEGSSTLGDTVLYALPFVLIIAAWIWMARRSTRPVAGATPFTRSRARVYQDDRPTASFADIAGYDSVKQEVREIVDFLRDPSKFEAIGARVPKGMLLVGPPGTGKTLFARAVAGEAQVPFISVTGSEFLELYVGVGAARVRDLFATARKNTPSIVFVDEIDAIGRKRGTGLGGGHDEREQTLNQLLAEIDGFDTTEGIVVMAATNRPDILDAALLRAGRFDRQVVIPLPTATERLAILEVHSRSKQLAADVDLDVIARATPGMSGVDLANLLNEAALIAVRREATAIAAEDLDGARDRVLLGVRRSSLVLTPGERHVVAYHEAGHAVLASVLPGADPVHKVTILPVGMALGATEQVPVEERQVRRRAELDDALAVRLGGRAAEELVFGEISTGGADDLVAASDLARRMVREWGMSQQFGHMAWASQGPVFLGEDLIHTRDYSDETAKMIDEEVVRILEEQAGRAKSILQQSRHVLDAVASGLLEHETLEADDLARILHPSGARSDGDVLGLVGPVREAATAESAPSAHLDRGWASADRVEQVSG